MQELRESQNEGADIVVNFPFPLKETFSIGGGGYFINKAKEMLKSNPIDYSALKKKKWRSLFRSLLTKQK
jgi:hypothetical protein